MQPFDFDQIFNLQPELPKALLALGQAIEASGLEPDLLALLKVRASQLNGCAACLAMHLAAARRRSESQARLDLLSVWPEAGLFSAREQAALQWTETLTRLADQSPDQLAAAQQTMSQVFSAQEWVNLTTAIGVINAWNRIARGLGCLPAV